MNTLQNVCLYIYIYIKYTYKTYIRVCSEQEVNLSATEYKQCITTELGLSVRPLQPHRTLQTPNPQYLHRECSNLPLECLYSNPKEFPSRCLPSIVNSLMSRFYSIVRLAAASPQKFLKRSNTVSLEIFQLISLITYLANTSSRL